MENVSSTPGRSEEEYVDHGLRMIGLMAEIELMATKSYSLKFNGYWREPTIGGLPAHSGVYCVYACSYDAVRNSVALRQLIYIGESGNVRQRVANHPGWDAWRTFLNSDEELCISTAHADSSARVRIEAACIHHHQPPSNIEFKDAFPFDTTTVSVTQCNTLLTPLFIVYRKIDSGKSGVRFI